MGADSWFVSPSNPKFRKILAGNDQPMHMLITMDSLKGGCKYVDFLFIENFDFKAYRVLLEPKQWYMTFDDCRSCVCAWGKVPNQISRTLPICRPTTPSLK